MSALSAPKPEGEWVLVPREFLEAAVCPMKESGCDGTQYPVHPHGEGEQCQWCYERRAALSAPQPPAEAQTMPDWGAAPPGATHYQPHQDAYYKRVSASEWYVWSRKNDRELMRWLPSPGTRDNAEWVVRPAEAQPGWYCAHCQRGVDAREVTYSEQHEVCGRYIANDEPPPPSAPEAQPVAWQFQDCEGNWHEFIDERHRLNTIEDGSWPIRALYAHPPPSAPQQASDLSRSLKLAAAEEQAEAWQAVCALLSELRPGWAAGPGSGQELALAAIRHAFATPPPSAPVGDAEDMVLDAIEWRGSSAPVGVRYDAGLLSDYGGGNVGWWHDYIRSELDRAHDFYTEALAQQPASDPRSTHRVWRGDDWLPCYCEATDDHRIGSEQPAAVDGECAIAAIQFALNDPEGMTFLRLWNEGEFETLRREWPEAPSSIYAGADALAAQPGGAE